LVEIRDERAAAAGAVVDYRGLVGDGGGVLDVEVGFGVVLGAVLVVAAAVDLGDGEVLVLGVRGVDRLEEL